MPRFSLSSWRIRAILAVTFALVLTLASSIFAFAAVPIVQISSDPYTNTTSQHKTQVEPDTFSFGSTIVSDFQSGRFTDGGSSNIGWATSTNNGGCLASSDTVLINVTPGPIVNAGADQTVCANNATVNLTGNITHATGGIWSTNGSGTFNPNNT